MTAVHLVGLLLRHKPPIDFICRETVTDPLTELFRKRTWELPQAAVEAERDAFLAEFAECWTADGRAAVVRSGHHPECAVQTRIRPVTVKVPKVRAKDGKPVTFRSALVPPCVRKAKSIEAALPWLYLKKTVANSSVGFRICAGG